MFSRFSNLPQSHSETGYAGEGLSVLSEAGEIRSDVSSPAENLASRAQEAVDAVLQAADRMSSRDQRSVNLNFSVGDAQLAVRVELQGGEVRTTFRTDSPELRAALAHEWEAVAGGAGDRALRLAPPSITGADSSTANDFSGERSPRQHDREPRQVAVPSDLEARDRTRTEPPISTPVSSRGPQPSDTTHRLLSFA